MNGRYEKAPLLLHQREEDEPAAFASRTGGSGENNDNVNIVGCFDVEQKVT